MKMCDFEPFCEIRSHVQAMTYPIHQWLTTYIDSYVHIITQASISMTGFGKTYA